MDATSQARITSVFRRVNRAMVLFWRLGLGRWLNIWPRGSGRIMVISHRGRRSGTLYRTPLNYAEVDGDVYCVAGFGRRSDWYRNARANPHVEVWLPGRDFRGVVEDVSDSEQRVPLLRAVLLASGFASAAAGVPVRRLTDDQLADATSDYVLLRIAADPDPAPIAPAADLAWVWRPVAAGALVAAVAWRLQPRRCVRRATD